MKTLTDLKKLMLICGLVVPAFGQNANQWYGWAQCEVTTQGPAIDGNGTILGQYYHHETQTWQLTGAAPTGTVYPATWSTNASGWDTINSGESWTLSSPTFSAPLQVLQRASDNHWLVTAAPHSQITGAWATITPYRPSPGDGELPFPAVTGPPSALIINGSSSWTETAGKYGVYQPGGPTSQISCSWKFSKGTPPTPPIRQVVTQGPSPEL